MPRRTSLMSAPSRSHRLAISLMKLIFVASMALAAYLVISALSGDMTRNGCSVRRNGLYSSCRRPRHLGPAHADDDPVGLHEVVDGGPFLEKLRIAGHVDGPARPLPEPLGQGAIGADRHGALDDDDRVLADVCRHGIADGPQVGQIGRAAGRLRRAHCQENQPGPA